MNEKINKTSICSIVFLDIVDYSKKSVSEQIDIKNQFNHLINHSLKDVDQSDRIILDTGDGAAIAHLGSPEDALFVSLSIRDEILKNNIISPTPLYVRFGINLGPVRLVSDINGRPNIIGDGINVAERIMSFAKPNQIAVSRSYYDVTSRLTQEISQMFDYSGAKHDKHSRAHEIYTVRLLKESASTESKALNASLSFLSHFKMRYNWKLTAVALPLAMLCGYLIKATYTPREPNIIIEQATAATVPLAVTQPTSSPNKPLDSVVNAKPSLESKSAGGPILQNKPAQNVLPAPDVIGKVNANNPPDKAALKGGNNKENGNSKPKNNNKAKKSESSNLPPTDEASKAAGAALAKKDSTIDTAENTNQPPEKSSWKSFTDSVKQGQARNCTQAQISMNQCP